MAATQTAQTLARAARPVAEVVSRVGSCARLATRPARIRAVAELGAAAGAATLPQSA